MSEDPDTLFALEDQVKIVGPGHPWEGAIGKIVEKSPFHGYWHIELESVNPGHVAAALESDIQHV